MPRNLFFQNTSKWVSGTALGYACWNHLFNGSKSQDGRLSALFLSESSTLRNSLDVIEDISASQVSQVSQELDTEVAQFRQSKLSSFYPVVWIDALYEKIREDHKVTSKAVMIAMAINTEGQKEILAIEPMDNESTDTWTVFFDRLKARGLLQIGLLVSDAHLGIQSALKSAFVGTSWQRCKVHFMRNILARVPHKHKETVGKHLSHVFNQPSYPFPKVSKMLSNFSISSLYLLEEHRRQTTMSVLILRFAGVPMLSVFSPQPPLFSD